MFKVEEKLESNEVLNYLKDFDGIESKTINLLVNVYGFKTFNSLLWVKDEDIFEKNLFELNLCQKLVLREAINQVKNGLISMIIPSKVIKQEVNEGNSNIENTDDSEIRDNICQNIVINEIDLKSMQTNEQQNSYNLENNEVFNYLKNFTDIKEKTIEVLINKYEFNSKESLAFIEENDIKDFVELSFGQRIVLKKIITQLKTELEPTYGSTEVTKTDSLETEREVNDSINCCKDWTTEENENIECQTNPEIVSEDEVQGDQEMTEEVMPDIIEEAMICDNTKDSKHFEMLCIKESKVVLNDISVVVMSNNSNSKKVHFKCLSNNCNKSFDLRLKMKIHYNSIHKKREINNDLRESRVKNNSIKRKSLRISSNSYSNHSSDNYVTNNKRKMGKAIYFRENSNDISDMNSLRYQWECLPQNEKNEYRIKALIENRIRGLTDNRERNECNTCKRSFDQYFKYISHMVYDHNSGQMFNCIICGILYKASSSIVEHILAVHERKMDFKCKKCLKCCSCRQTLFAHLKRCNAKV